MSSNAILVSNEFQRLPKEAVETYFKTLVWNFPGYTKEGKEILPPY